MLFQTTIYMRILYSFLFLLISFSVFSQSFLKQLHSDVKENILKADYHQALSLLDRNKTIIANDTTGLFDAWISLNFFEKNWKGVIDAYQTHHFMGGEDTTVLSMARFYLSLPAEKIIAPQSVNLSFKPSSSGTPIIEVSINGKTYHFWFDTGAGLTVLSKRTAIACNVKTALNKGGAAIAATGNAVGIVSGLIDSLKMGDLKVYNHSCLILNNKDLEFKVLGIRILKIDGIIGWNLLQELDVTINNKTRKIDLSLEEQKHEVQNNFFWLDQPLISCTDTANNPLVFFIDTGAGTPGVYNHYLSRADTSLAKKKQITMGSAGGFKKINTLIFPSVKVKLADKLIVMKKVSVEPAQEGLLFPCDGVFGINEFKNAGLHFNMRKGFFEVLKL